MTKKILAVVAFLIVGISYQNCGSEMKSLTTSSSDLPPLAPEDIPTLQPTEFDNQAAQILEDRCATCHDATSPQFVGVVYGNIDYIMDTPQMIARGVIVPGDPNSSPLYQSLTGNGATLMPPNDPLLVGEVQVISNWINALENAVSN